jgi:lambda family phage minor tail protein L
MQELTDSQLVELYQLDTSPIYDVNGVATQTGQIYRWTTGVIDVRIVGQLAPTGPRTATHVTLDRLMPIQSGRSYKVVIQTGADPEDASAALPCFGQTVTIDNPYGAGTISATQLSLLTPLAAAPPALAAYTFMGVNAARLGGQDYVPLPIEVTGFEWAGTGKIPRPKLRVSNVGGLAGALVIAHGGLLGAKVTRIRTFREFLDDGANPDPSGFMEPDIFYVDRVAAHRKALVEFELAAALDQQGVRLPKRVMLRDTCGFTYRQWVVNAAGVAAFVPGTCPYAGSTYFKIDDTSSLIPAEDVCGYRLASCIARFGASTNLPFNAFPGISLGGTR